MIRYTLGVQRYALLAAVTVGYFIVGRLSLQLASENPSASPVWPPTGIALALVLLLSARVWPAIFVGAFLVNLATAGTVLTSLGIALGNTLEALAGGLLVWRYAGGQEVLARASNLLRFVVLAALISPVISATLGVGSLALGGFVERAAAPAVWLTWWLGDATGALLVAPLILAWMARDRPRFSIGELGEAALLLASLAFVTLAVFGDLLALAEPAYPLSFLCMPFLLWAALRFEQRGATLATALFAALAIDGTLKGFGAFAPYPVNESLMLLQAFVGVLAVMALMVAAVGVERREAEERLRHLAVSDPLTGLANYRMLIDRLHAEIARTRRTNHPFVVLFMDLDGLKKINDSQGHVTGNRALLRLAKALKESCRSLDLVARFGGDEFVIVMPESDEAAAGVLVRRLEARLAHSTEKPPVMVSTGAAVHPRDGDAPEALLKAADARLYEGRRRIRGVSDPPTRRDDVGAADALE